MKTALVLAGGGSRGAYQIGIWQALRELGITVDIVTGTSVGALNGALIAQNSFEEAVALWEEIDTSMVFDLTEKPSLTAYAKEFLKKGGASAQGLRELLARYVDEDKIRTSQIAFGLVTVKKKGLEPLEVYTEDIPKGQLCDYLMASAACFPAVKGHQIEETEYIDGGYYDNMPIHLAEQKGAKRMIVVNLESVGLIKNSVKELKEAKNVTYISPKWDLGNFLIFEKETARRNIRLGYLDTLKAFSFFDGTYYTFAKHDFSRLAKQKHITLRNRKEFFSAARIKGNLLQTAGYAALEKALQAETRDPLTIPIILTVAAETAGKILEVSPLMLYSAESFHDHLKATAQQLGEEKQIAALVENIFNKKLPFSPDLLKNLDSKTIALCLARIFQTNPEVIFSAAPLFPKEAIAGFYLMVFDLL